jgi:hypothetical protein
VLSFFVLDDVRLHREVGWSDAEINARDCTCVQFFARDTRLARRSPPATLPPEHTMPVSKPTFRRVDTWPQVEGTIIGGPSETRSPEGITLSDEAWTCWAEHGPESPPNLLLGHPAGCEYPIGRDPDSRLLLSLEAPSSGLSWDVFGRNGFLFLRIPQRSLENGLWNDALHKEW